MTYEVRLSDIIKEHLIALAKKYEIDKIILFGSRAKGTNRERSDIDLAVSGKNVRDFTFDADELIPTLLKFDITNLNNRHSEEFLEEIKNTGVILYEKLNNFKKSLNILLKSDKLEADDSEIYRSGVIATFNLTFELAWKSVKERLESMGVNLDFKGSPRAVLKEGYAYHIIDDEEIWLDMLEKRNQITHIYDEYEADELAKLIFEKYMKELQILAKKLEENT